MQPAAGPIPSLCFLVRSLVALGALAAPCIGASRAYGQDATAPLPEARVAALAARFAVARVIEGTAWAVGPDYKARFEGGGFDLFPALGRAAPRSYPLSFRLESVRVGHALLWAGGASPEPCVEDPRVTYARPLAAGGLLEERYEATDAGLAQSFVLHERPTARGDLVVRGRLSTDLAVVAADPSVGIELRAGDLGGVTIGRVTGVDAGGRRAEGSIRLEGDALELALPAAFVDAADFPLVLDPIYAPEVALSANADDPDSAWEEASGRTLLVYMYFYSASDYDIHGLVLDDNGTPIGLVPIDVDLDLVLNPSVATNAKVGAFGVVWSKTHETGPFQVQVARVTPTGSLSPRVTLSSLVDVHVPDVGGDLTGTGDGVIVVWEEDGAPQKIVAARVALSGALPVPTSYATVWPDISVDFAIGPVQISKGVGFGRHLIVFLRDFAGETRVYGRGIGLDGVLDPATYVVSPSGADGARGQRVDGDGALFWISWSHGFESSARRMTFAGTGATLEAPIDLHNDAWELAVGAAKLWILQGNAGVLELVGRGLWTGALCEGPLDVGDGGSPDTALVLRRSGAAAGLVASGSVEAAGHVAWRKTGGLYGLSFEELGPGGPTTDLGGGCGGGTCTTQGPAAIGVPPSLFEVRLQGAPSQATMAILNVAMPSTPITCGTCAVAPFQLTWTLPVVAGSAKVPVGIPADALLIGSKIHAQWTVSPAGATPCPAVANLAFSNRLEIEIGP